MTTPSQNNQPGTGVAAIGASLIGLIGASAALWLLTDIPKDESGRKVRVEVTEQGGVSIDHVSGEQYLDAYVDIAGVPTACDGITRGVKRGQRYSEEQCTAMLVREIEIHAAGVLQCAPSLRASGRDYQRAAAISLAYNIGVGAFCGSSAKREFEAGRFVQGCGRFLAWNKARVGGRLQPVRGLTRRRHREREVCVTGLLRGATPDNVRARVEAWR